MKQKYAKNKIFKICEIDYNSFTNLENETHAITVSKFSETCSEKFVKSHQVNLFLAVLAV